MVKPPLIIIAGPTAVGKTAISVKLAKKLNAEIISADSMQVYKGLDIGTAKITEEEMDGVRHHMIDILDPSENFDVSVFKEKFDECVMDILSRNHIPIMVGGTGFYIQAALYGIDFNDNAKSGEYRKHLEELIKDGKASELFEKLKEVDPKSAEIIHPNNHVRLTRALEYYHETGEPISSHNEKERNKESRFRELFCVITDDREKLYDRIDKRVDKMMEDGLLKEVERLVNLGLNKDNTSMKGIGYHELIPIPEDAFSLFKCVSKIKQDSRHYAKRQLTWFRREKNVTWIDRCDFKDNDSIVDFIYKKYVTEIENGN
ncbi:MAG: tRNA (adenosine(37)-N6)-dimethylallyltransferase MiaA [Lachnospiraceae bacterium]|nr:tRNA (adenosine(37)-N6)-dimethylallyltransferase MiaA [Lachnospiraceae bacterium]